MKNCPFCDSGTLSIERDVGYIVMCSNCLCRGPYSDSEEKAVSAWNNRGEDSMDKSSLVRQTEVARMNYGYSCK